MVLSARACGRGITGAHGQQVLVDRCVLRHEHCEAISRVVHDDDELVRPGLLLQDLVARHECRITEVGPVDPTGQKGEAKFRVQCRQLVTRLLLLRTAPGGWKLLLTSSLGPFAVAFFIAVFVLVIQIMWLYIDEIAGKGVGIIVMLELLAYLSVSMFPMALPIAILIASVMVMGNLAERCELSSLKSAGVPLIRIMRGLILCASVTGVFSYLCSNFIIPVSNLGFKSRLTDIQRQKPALALEKGVFNEDFRHFSIHS